MLAVVRQLHWSEKAGEEEEAADDEQGCWTQEYREYVFESRRNRGFVDLVVGPGADRGIAHNGMVSDDPSHQQRPEVVRRNDSGRPLPLVSARGAGGRLDSGGPPRSQHASDTAVLFCARPKASVRRQSCQVDDTVSSRCGVIAPTYPNVNPTVAVRARVTLIAAIATPSEPLGATGSRLGTGGTRATLSPVGVAGPFMRAQRRPEGSRSGTWTRHGDGGVSGPISQATAEPVTPAEASRRETE